MKSFTRQSTFFVWIHFFHNFFSSTKKMLDWCLLIRISEEKNDNLFFIRLHKPQKQQNQLKRDEIVFTVSHTHIATHNCSNRCVPSIWILYLRISFLLLYFLTDTSAQPLIWNQWIHYFSIRRHCPLPIAIIRAIELIDIQISAFIIRIMLVFIDHWAGNKEQLK